MTSVDSTSNVPSGSTVRSPVPGATSPLTPTSPSPTPSTVVIVLGDVVLLSQQRVAVVKWIGRLPEHTGIYYGVEIRMTEGPLGNCDGKLNETRYFDCAPNCGLFAKYDEIERRISPSELLEKVISLTKKNTLMHRLLQSPSKNDNSKDKYFSRTQSTRDYNYTHHSSIVTQNSNQNHHNDKNNLTSNDNNGNDKTNNSNNVGNNNNVNDSGNNNNNNNNNTNSNDETSMTQSQSDTMNLNSASHLNKNFYNKRESSSHRATFHFSTSNGKDSNNNNNNGNNNNNHPLSKSRDITGRYSGYNSNNNIHSIEHSMSAVSVISEKSESNASRRHSLSNQNRISLPNIGKVNNDNDNKNDNDSIRIPIMQRPTSTPAGSASVQSQNDIEITFAKYDGYKHKKRSDARYEDNENDMNEDNYDNRLTFLHVCDFKPLFEWFDSVLDFDKDGVVSFTDWQYNLIELSPHFKYELDTSKIQKCFNEFDLAKNNILTKEECAVVMGKTYLRAIAKKKNDFKKHAKRKLELQSALVSSDDIDNKENHLSDDLTDGNNNFDDKDYLKYGYLTKISSIDIKSYFVSIINHMLKKMNSSERLQSPRVNVNFDSSIRRHSKSLSSRRKPPPPKRSSRQLSVSKNRALSGATPPPPPPRKDSKSVNANDEQEMTTTPK